MCRRGHAAALARAESAASAAEDEILLQAERAALSSASPQQLRQSSERQQLGRQSNMRKTPHVKGWNRNWSSINVRPLFAGAMEVAALAAAATTATATAGQQQQQQQHTRDNSGRTAGVAPARSPLHARNAIGSLTSSQERATRIKALRQTMINERKERSSIEVRSQRSVLHNSASALKDVSSHFRRVCI